MGRSKLAINTGTCSVGGCVNPALTKGLCRLHYDRMRRYGSFADRDKKHRRCRSGLHEMAKTRVFDNAGHSYCGVCQKKRNSTQKFKSYGITEGQFIELLEQQNGACAICGSREWGGFWGKPHIDHDHQTGEVRGILCLNCNRGIGMLGDDPHRVAEAAAYLARRGRTREFSSA